MTYPRHRFDGLSLEFPPGLFEDDEAPSDCAAALAAAAPATLRVWRILRSGCADLASALAEFCSSTPRNVEAVGEDFLWPGLAADESTDLRKAHYVFESRGVVYYGLAASPDDLWADYGPFLEGAMLSLDIGGRPSPTLPILRSGGAPRIRYRPASADPIGDKRRSLEAASGEAIALVLDRRFTEAESLIQKIDSDIYGANALAEIYETAVGAAPTNDEIFNRAILWTRRGFPDPHTAEEAEQYAAAIDEREARIAALRKAP